MVKRILFSLLFIVLFSTGSYALEFYQGNIHVQQLHVSASVGESISLSADYTLFNSGISAETSKLSFPGYSKNAAISLNGESFSGSITLQPGETGRISVSDSAAGKTEFSINPDVLFDGKAGNARVDSVKFDIILREPYSLISSSLPLAGESPRYSYERANIYPEILQLRWAKFQPKLELSRSFSPVAQAGEIMNITLRVKNMGGALSNIKLSDAFLASNFKPFSPSEEFTFVQQPNEAFYKWSKTISSLDSNQEEIFQYSVLVTSITNLRLLSAEAYVDGIFAAGVDQEWINPISQESFAGEGLNASAFEGRGGISGLQFAGQGQGAIGAYAPKNNYLKNKSYALLMVWTMIIIFLILVLGAGAFYWYRRHKEQKLQEVVLVKQDNMYEGGLR